MTSPSRTSPTSDTTAVILAGGAGSSLGFRDKALLSWRGKPFISHIINDLETQVGQIVVNSNQAAMTEFWSGPVIADPFSDRRGPLAGILAGLLHCRTTFALFVPCDNPQVAPDLARRLHAALATGTANIAYARSRKGEHYLHALVRVELRDHLRQFLENRGRAVRQWYAQQNCCAVDFDDRVTCFSNINTQADLDSLAP